MTQINAPSLVGAPLATSSARVRTDRLFYPLAGILLMAIALIGFSDFYFHGRAFPNRPLTPPIRMLLIVHGIAQLGWLLLIVLQPALVAGRSLKMHMRIGRVGAIFALLLVTMGYFVGVGAARANPPELELFGMKPPQFLYVPLMTITIFGAMVALAVWQRKRPEIHRSLMLMGTIAAMSAAMGRIQWLNDFFAASVWFRVFGPVHSSVTLGLLLLAVRCLMIRRFDKWLAISLTAMSAVFVVMHQVSATGAWQGVARFLMG
ncbi:MAG: hypothetical protein H6818_21065 [Phycisphaerales bacterium]|nr:hypothetical protein [Phycisphaerales bacterium]MCB9862283.1 hypothetical protein [Phycisphaerales bacterium]